MKLKFCFAVSYIWLYDSVVGPPCPFTCICGELKADRANLLTFPCANLESMKKGEQKHRPPRVQDSTRFHDNRNDSQNHFRQGNLNSHLQQVGGRGSILVENKHGRAHLPGREAKTPKTTIPGKPPFRALKWKRQQEGGAKHLSRRQIQLNLKWLTVRNWIYIVCHLGYHGQQVIREPEQCHNTFLSWGQQQRPSSVAPRGEGAKKEQRKMRENGKKWENDPWKNTNQIRVLLLFETAYE